MAGGDFGGKLRGIGKLAAVRGVVAFQNVINGVGQAGGLPEGEVGHGRVPLMWFYYFGYAECCFRLPLKVAYFRKV